MTRHLNGGRSSSTRSPGLTGSTPRAIRSRTCARTSTCSVAAGGAASTATGDVDRSKRGGTAHQDSPRDPRGKSTSTCRFRPPWFDESMEAMSTRGDCLASRLQAKGRLKMPIQAKRYLLSIYQPEGGTPPPEVLEKVMREVEAGRRERKAAGGRVFGGGLYPKKIAGVARLKGGKVHVTDGPFTETKEFLGGICIITAPDLDAALEWGGKLARATTLPIEVRPFQDDPGDAAR